MSKLNKTELIAKAHQLGLTVDDQMTNAQLQEAIDDVEVNAAGPETDEDEESDDEEDDDEEDDGEEGEADSDDEEASWTKPAEPRQGVHGQPQGQRTANPKVEAKKVSQARDLSGTYRIVTSVTTLVNGVATRLEPGSKMALDDASARHLLKLGAISVK